MQECQGLSCLRAGKYKGDNTAYLLGYSIVPANKTATNSATLAF